MDALVMRRNHKRHQSAEAVSVRQAAGHFAMGASLGTVGALLLMISNAGTVRELLASGPGMPVGVFVAMCACTVAIGATLTGVIFSAIEDEQRRQR
jgi:hypothetical protein